MSFFPESPSLPDLPAATSLQDLYGFVPRFFRLQREIPHIVSQQVSLAHALLGNETHLSRAQKERILLASSAARGSTYGVALHEQMLKLLGVSESEIAHIVNGGVPEGPDAELIACSRSLLLNQVDFRASNIERLRRVGFSERQITETIVLIGLADLLNTVQFGTGAVPDFATRPLPKSVPAPSDNKLHPQAGESRPISEERIVDPDADDVLRAQAGDLSAFEILVERHSERVYRTLVGLLGNRDDAKDALQDTFLKVFQSLPRFERRARFSTWLVSIATNTGLQQLRERKQLESLDEDPTDNEEFRPRQVRAWSDDPEQMFSKEQRRELVERGISHLPAKFRVVLMLRDVQQMSTEEAAAALALSIPATKARLLRARLMLRENLAPHFSEGAQNA